MRSLDLIPEVLGMHSRQAFNEWSLRLFHYQSEHNDVYRNYLDAIKIAPHRVNSVTKIPFLPIEFFKSHRVTTGEFEAQCIFSSSGSTGANASQHFVKEAAVYEKTFLRAFEMNYGDPGRYAIFALLPAYLERTGSSLVTMANRLIELSGQVASGFFLYDHAELAARLKEQEKTGKQSLLLGVTFALLDFAENESFPLKNTIVMETGGMKGKREELTREEVSRALCDAFSLEHMHSEY